ncbi:MAG: DUF4830 domain-containing protein [Ruminococcaceae bacterium]|nr:DUF4830 domain-containing protein [Oscillospiraceae bacterium]
MFIYSLRASTLKFFGIVCVALAALITLIAFVPAYASGDSTPSGGIGTQAQTPVVGENSVTYNYDKVKSADAAAQFLAQFGWAVDAGSAECREVTIPAEFDKVFAGYNELQRSQGLDLSKYKKKELTRYTFTVTNYPKVSGTDYSGTVYANVLVYRNRVVAGDICSADVNGFIHGFEK